MSKKEIRYMFEHGLLPRWFFETTKDFVRTMLTEPSEFFDNLDRWDLCKGWKDGTYTLCRDIQERILIGLREWSRLKVVD